MDATSTPPGASLVGQVVSGRYRIDKLIGEGGMGAVYLAEHTHMRKRVALKLLHAEMSQDREVLARFRREAEAAAHVEHPNVATATDFGQTEDGSFFLVLEYIEGTSLRAAIDLGAMPPGRALHIARQIALGLERAHGSGIVHRDLKPENVMLVKKGDDPDFVKVLDFGIAKVEPNAQRDGSQPLTRLGTIIGTPEYMAPEQALGEPVTPASDLYALGVILYELLTGRHPFDAPDRTAVLSMHIVAPVPAMAERHPELPPVPPAVEALTRRLLEKDATLRPQNARALIDAIDGVAAESNIELLFATPSSPSSLGGARVSQTDVGRPSRSWTPNDALAKTDYGAPTPRAVTARSETPWSERIPRTILVAIAALTGVVVLVSIVAIILGRRSAPLDPSSDGGSGASPSEARKPASPRAPPAKVTAAKAQGIPALRALAEQYPRDLDLRVEVARLLAAEGQTRELLIELRAIAGVDKNVIDAPLLAAVIAAAQRAETADEAFGLLEGPLGARGVDGLVELSTSKTPGVRTRATKSLARDDVRAHATPATLVLLDLGAAKTCAAKREPIERAKTDGDARVVTQLKALKNPRGCGFLGMRDCWQCLRRDSALDEAIRAVEARPAP